MLTRPAHAFVTGPERAARARALKREAAGYIEGRRALDAQQRRAAVERQLEQPRQAAETAAAQAAAQPAKPVAQMTATEFKAAQRGFVRSLRGA